MSKSRLPHRLGSIVLKDHSFSTWKCQSISWRKASTYNGVTELSEDIDSSSPLYAPALPEDRIEAFDPSKRSRKQKRWLPRSRFVPTLFSPSHSALILTNLPPFPKNLATSIAPPDLIVALYTLTSHLPLQTLLLAASSQAPSPSHDCNKPIQALWPPTSSHSSTTTIPPALSLARLRPDCAPGRVIHRISKTGPCALRAEAPSSIS